MTCSDDPRLQELQAALQTVKFGEPDTLKDQLKPILSDASLFGTDLVQAGLSGKITEMFREELRGPGAVRETLEKWL